MKKNIFLLTAVTILFHLQSCQNKKPATAEKDDLMFTKTKSDGDDRYKNTILEGAFKKLKSGADLTSEEILEYASHIETRADLYKLLADFNKVNQFPNDYNNFEKAGESVLTGWLQYPTELDTIPSQIELVKKVIYKADDHTNVYYVYKFRTDAPHWASKYGWMLGVVGPYMERDMPYDWVGGTFSRFTKMNETTPEQEVDWCYKNVYKRNPGVQ